MDPIALDIRTLSFITVLFAFGFGAGLVTFGVAHPTYSGLKQVGLGLAFIGLGCLLIGYRHTVSPAISIVAANTFLVLSFVLINLGIRNFRQLARSDVWFGVPIVACVVMTLYYFTYVQPSFPHRVFWVGVWLAVLSAMCCRSVLQDARNMAVPQKILATGFGLFSVFMLIRSWLVLDESAMQDFMAASTIHGLAFLAVILFVVNVSFGLIWMANDQLLQEHKKYEQIIATTPDGIALLDKDGRYRMVNAAILKFLGLSREEVLGKRSLDLFGPDFYEKITLPNIQKAFAGETGATSTWVTLPHREKIYVSVTYHPLPDAKGNIPLAAIHITNMTALHLAQQEKQRIFDLSLDICCVGGMDGYFLEINPAWTQMLGWSEKEVLSRPWSDFTHPDDLQISRDAVQQLTEGKPVVDFVNRVLAKDGTYRYISWMTYPDMEAQRFYSVGRDVSNRIRMEEELREFATKDPLTKADNRRVFMQRLDDEAERSARYGTPLSVLMLDIDHFKSVNDTYGHAVGDSLLQLCVEVCQKNLRTTDGFGRIGGEEFAAVLPHTDLETGFETAERLRHNLSGCVLETESGPLQFTVSIGAAELQAEESAKNLLKRTDDALYLAKKQGRNRVEKG